MNLFSNTEHFARIPRVDRLAIIVLVLFLTSQLYKGSLSLPVDVTLLYGGTCAVLICLIFLRDGGIGAVQLRALTISLLCLYLMPLFFTYAANLDSRYTSEKIIGFFGFTLLSLVAPIMLLNDYRRVRYFVRTLLIVCAAGVAYVDLQALFAGTLYTASVRTEGFSANVILISRLAAGAAVIAFLQWRARDPVLPRQLCFVLFVLLVFASLITGSRGPFFGMIIVLILLDHTNIRSGTARVKRFAALACVLALAYFLAPLAVSLLPEASAAKIASSDPSARIMLWREGMEIFLSNPLGVGFGEYASHTGESAYLGLVYPHNLVIEYLIETGFVGGGFLIALLVHIYTLQRPRASVSDVYTLSYAMFVFFLIQAMVSADMNGNRLLFCFIGIELMKNALPEVDKRGAVRRRSVSRRANTTVT